MVRKFALLLSTSLLLGRAGVAVCAESPSAGLHVESLTSKAYVRLADFTGSLAATAAEAVRAALEQSGDFLFEGAGKPYVVRAVASGGKIHGSLVHPDGKVMFSENYDNLGLRANALQFADEIQSVLLGRPGIGMTQVAFVSDVTGFKEIYTCAADGSNVKQVTHDSSTCVSPDLRNDAAYLSFTSYVSGYPDIYLIDLKNGNRRRIVNAPGTNSGASFSPDGERLAMTMSFSGNPEIYITNPGGLGGRRLTTTSWAESSPAWSPDGKRIAFSANPNGKPAIFIVPSAGGSATQVLNGFQYATEPNWSPDGNLLAATVRQGARLSVALTDLHMGTTRVVAEGQDACWGVDGRHLLYVQRDHLILHHIGNDTKRTIISNLGHVSQPTWSR